MSGRVFRLTQSGVCAYCDEPLASTSFGIAAWRAGSEFVCNEFCADEISSKGSKPSDQKLGGKPLVQR